MNERADARVVAQQRDVYCGCACALTILSLMKLQCAHSQDAIFELGGGMPFSVETLSGTLNSMTSPSGGWRGHGVQPPPDRDYGWVIQRLSEEGHPWIAHLRDPHARMGHFVVVAGRQCERIEILDPLAPGTAYEMTEQNFLEHWNYQIVYRTVTP